MTETQPRRPGSEAVGGQRGREYDSETRRCLVHPAAAAREAVYPDGGLAWTTSLRTSSTQVDHGQRIQPSVLSTQWV